MKVKMREARETMAAFLTKKLGMTCHDAERRAYGCNDIDEYAQAAEWFFLSSLMNDLPSTSQLMAECGIEASLKAAKIEIQQQGNPNVH